MITGPLKSQIDKLWLEFHTGGITNPITVIEQISFLMFIRLLDTFDERRKNQAERAKKEFRGTFSPDEQRFRWSNFKNLSGDEMLPLVRDEVFPFLRRKLMESGESGGFTTFFQDASFLIQKPSLLVSAVDMVDKLPLTEGDTKGDLYEYLLSKLTTAGINGQFRTPRHIIRMMVEMVAPRPDERIADPACGTGGFLVEAMQYLQRSNTSPEMIYEDDGGEKVYPGDLLEPYREHIQHDAIYGFEFDITMLRIAALNLLLHGIEEPNILYADTLGKKFGDNQTGLAANKYDVVLANPPFTGALDLADVHFSLASMVKTRKTELLFLALILRMMRQGGRSATIVPDGVLFGSSGAHQTMRKMLVENNQLEAVISMPSGVFKPYAGVSTGILVFTKGGTTKDVWFYDMQADGRSLDDKRTEFEDQFQHEKNNIPDILNRWSKRDSETERLRTDQSFMVPKAEIMAENYDLTFKRYYEPNHEETVFDPPQVILAELKELENEIQGELQALEAMIG